MVTYLSIQSRFDKDDFENINCSKMIYTCISYNLKNNLKRNDLIVYCLTTKSKYKYST